jgi:TnsA endonuclease N terminal
MHFRVLPGRLIPPKSRALTGRLTLRDGSTVPFESALERDCLILLDFDAPGRLIRSQPFTLEFTEDERLPKWRRYTPDILVTFGPSECRHPLAIEVKPLDTLQEALVQDSEKYAAMRAYCLEMGWAFEIRTETEIRQGDYLKNATFLRRYLTAEYRAGQAYALTRCLRRLGRSTPNALIHAAFPDTGLHAHGIWVLWCVVARRAILMDFHAPLNMATTDLWLSEECGDDGSLPAFCLAELTD